MVCPARTPTVTSPGGSGYPSAAAVVATAERHFPLVPTRHSCRVFHKSSKSTAATALYPPRRRSEMEKNSYIYIYMRACVCVCVCVRIGTRVDARSIGVEGTRKEMDRVICMCACVCKHLCDL